VHPVGNCGNQALTIRPEQTGKSFLSEAIAIGTASLELFQHEIDRRCSMVRYTIWVLPTLGFVGTVLGISQGLRFTGVANPPEPTLLQELTQILAVEFDTTLIALSLAAVLILAQHSVQRYEETLNAAGQCCIAKFHQPASQ
jgi:hypothetical protein